MSFKSAPSERTASIQTGAIPPPACAFNGDTALTSSAAGYGIFKQSSTRSDGRTWVGTYPLDFRVGTEWHRTRNNDCPTERGLDWGTFSQHPDPIKINELKWLTRSLTSDRLATFW